MSRIQTRYGMLLAWLAATVLPWAADAAEVAATCPEPSPDEAENREMAKQWFGEAQGYVEMGKYGEAVGAYACSYRFVNHPNTLYNMGQAALTAGNDELALSMFGEYLADNPDGEFASKCRIRMTAIENRAERLERARRAEAQAAEPPAADPALIEENAATQKALARSYQHRRLFRLVGLGSLVAGGTCLAMGIGFQAASVRQENKALDADVILFTDERVEKSRQYQVAATALFVSAGITAAFGVPLFLLNKGTSPDDVALRLTPGLGSLALTGRF